MPEAVCIVCGEGKSSPWEVCEVCKFDPKRSQDSLVKSVYLSTGRYDDECSKKIYRNYLNEIAMDIKGRNVIQFHEPDIDRLKRQMNMIKDVKWYYPWISVGEYIVKYSLKSFIIFLIIFLIIKAMR